MKFKRGALIIGFVLVIAMISFASANFNFAGKQITKTYSGGDVVSGRFNMSFSSQRNANFTSSFSGSMSLSELLNKSGFVRGTSYNCDPSNCKTGLNSTNGQGSRTIQISDKKTLGFVVRGSNVSINDLSLDISSDAGKSCINQFSLDVGNDGNSDFYNPFYVDEECGVKGYGCFVSQNTVEVNVGNQEYCEKMTIPRAPAYRIGANVKNGTGSPIITMWMYNASGGILGECDLNNLTQSGYQEESCVIKYSSNQEKDVFVCLSANQDSDFKIKTEVDSPCGKINAGGSSFTRDYEIFSRPLKYSSVSVTLNESTYGKYNSVSLKNTLQNYIKSNYGLSPSCTPECIIPFSIYTTSDQNVSLSSLNLEYGAAGAGSITESSIFDTVEREYTISSGNLSFDLSKLGFIAPNVNANRDFTLYFDGQQVFNENINITTGFVFDISPKFALIGRNTAFTASSSSGNITYSSWDYGDGSNIESYNSGKAIHKYSSAGDYDVQVEVKSAGNKTSKKIFKVSVGNAEQSADLTIAEYRIRISNLTKTISSMPAWIRSEIERETNISRLNSSLNVIYTDFRNATGDDEFVDIVDRLSALNVPREIYVSKKGTLPFQIGFNNIDVSYISEISKKEAVKSDELKLNIIDWINNNYDGNVYFETWGSYADSGTSDILTTFKVALQSKNSNVKSGYLIIDYPKASIKFNGDYGAQSVGGGSGTYIAISSSKNFEFLTDGTVKVSDLGMYLSPEISEFSLDTRDICKGDRCPKAGYPWLWVIIILAILFVIVLIIYIYLQEWYKKRYESHLFKSPNDLYNLINFIYNSRVGGLKDGEIKEKLSSKGWKKEQISYAFKKIDGKRTGMWEIPLFKSSENRRVVEEISRRNSGMLPDARFIKRPNI